jgi:hypothetical protein
MAHHDSSREIALATGSLLVGLLAFALLLRSIPQAFLFVVALIVFVAPGVVLAKRWLEGPAAVLAGSAVGYFVASLAASVLVRLELLSLASLLAASAGTLALVWLLTRSVRAVAPRSENGEAVWLGATLLFALLLVAFPFSRVGAHLPDGVAYRAYFSADLMTHLSVVSELQKNSYPLQNPFYGGDSLGYYWLFFAFPAVLGRWTSNEGALLALYLASGCLFTGLFFWAGRALGLSPNRSFLASVVVVGAVSYEGPLVLARYAFGAESFLDTNVDAFGRWALGLVSLDGLHRSILYTPQHLFSYSLLVVLIVLFLRGEPADRAGGILCGLLLGGMAGTSIVTAMLAGPWLVLVLFLRERSLRRFLALSFWVALPALSLLAWYFALGFFGDAGGALVARAPRWAELPAVLLFDCGALVLLVALRRRFERRDLEFGALAVLALLAVLFLDLEGYEGIWMAWRAGSVLLVALGFLAAPALGSRLGLRHVLVLAPAVVTVMLDVYNAQDVSNRRLSAGEFRWTTVVSWDEWEALHWIRSETAEDALVQWDVRARELGEWAFLPALGERRMAVGSPIFLLDLGKYRTRERRHVRPIFAGADAFEAHRLARELGIDYLFLGSRELQVRGEQLRKLFEADDLFREAFSNDGVTILEVRH